MILLLSAFLACESVEEKQTDTGSETENGEPASEETGPPWVPTGNGMAYFLDGLQSNSLFTLEMDVITPPPTDDAYSGYLVGENIADVYLGPIPVTDTTLLWQSEANLNALQNGYNRFEIRLSSTDEVIYAGQVDPVIEETYHRLLISSPSTPDGDGSLREIQETLQALIDHHNNLLTISGDIPALTAGVEQTLNTALVVEDDYDKNGTVEQIADYLPLIGENLAETYELDNLRNLVLEDLRQASTAAHEISPTHPIKDLANYAYDCTQLVGTYVQESTDELNSVAQGFTTEEVAIKERITNSNQFLQYAFEGYDIDENGSIDDFTEGTINCSIYYISQMAYMEVQIAQ